MEECLLRYSKSSVMEVNDIGHGPFDRVTLADAFAIVKQALCHYAVFWMCVCVGTLTFQVQLLIALQETIHHPIK